MERQPATELVQAQVSAGSAVWLALWVAPCARCAGSADSSWLGSRAGGGAPHRYWNSIAGTLGALQEGFLVCWSHRAAAIGRGGHSLQLCSGGSRDCFALIVGAVLAACAVGVGRGRLSGFCAVLRELGVFPSERLVGVGGAGCRRRFGQMSAKLIAEARSHRCILVKCAHTRDSAR